MTCRVRARGKSALSEPGFGKVRWMRMRMAIERGSISAASQLPEKLERERERAGR
jgi:hypothetical protein